MNVVMPMEFVILPEVTTIIIEYFNQLRHVFTDGRDWPKHIKRTFVGYSLGTAFLQLGYQKGGALTVAGLATLLTNALPIAAGTVALGEPVPSGVFGGVRILAFAAVTLGAILLARPDRGPPAPIAQ